MSLGKSILLIRDYENIRGILRDVYIYGCFSKDDFVERGISGRKFDNEQRRINAYLPNKFVKKRRVNKKVLTYCTYDISESQRNYLAESYRNKSFTMLDIMSYFFVNQILGKEEMSLAEILELLPVVSDNIEFTKDNLRIKLDELCEAGFIECKKEGRNVTYKLAEDIWETFSDDELREIYIFLHFVENVSPVEVPFYYLQKKLKLYMECNRNIEIEKTPIFQFKHNHLFNSVDNEILVDLLKMINEGKLIEVQLDSSTKPFNVIPMKIMHDCTYGRQYLLSINEEYGSISNIRVDKIIGIKVIRKLSSDETQLKVESLKRFDYCWCTSVKKNEPQEVIIHFLFDEVEEAYILRRIEREGHGGTLDKIGEGVFEYRIKVYDPGEMVPWIRSFGERAKVINSGAYDIETKIRNDWKMAVRKYESIS